MGWEKEQVLGLLNFVDWMVALPKSLHEQFKVELEKFDGEVTMPYINSFERNGIE